KGPCRRPDARPPIGLAALTRATFRARGQSNRDEGPPSGRPGSPPHREEGMRFRFMISLAAAAVWAAAQIAALPVLARAHDHEGDEETDAQWVARASESDHYNQGITHREVRRLNFH